MSLLRDPMYSTHSGRTQNQAHILTPYSVVSSFNLPATYDSSLITPVSLSSSPPMIMKSAPAMKREPENRVSPSPLSPGYQLFGGDDDHSPRYNPPMKLKDPNGILRISAADSSFPASPYICPSPYFGDYGVSATPQSARTSNSSPCLHPSPNMSSASGLNNDSRHPRQQTPAQSAHSYRTSNHTPILVAPSPLSLRPATKQEGGPYRQNSSQSTLSTPHSQLASRGAFREPVELLPRGKKRKEVHNDSYENYPGSKDITPEEQLLLQLTEDDKLAWKDVATRFNQVTGKNLKVPALQMRKKRLKERLRVWTDSEQKALALSHEEYEKKKWKTIANNMPKYGSREKWSTEAIQRKANEMQLGNAQYDTVFVMGPRDTYQISSDIMSDQRSWSDGLDSERHSLNGDNDGNLMHTLSNSAIENVRSRAPSDASTSLHLDQQMIFEQHHQQHSGWDSGS